MASPAVGTAPSEGPLPEGSSSVVVQPAIPTSTPIADKHVFGLRQDGPAYTSSQPIFSDDYEKRFPEDAYCEENGPNARVYRTYVEEAAAYDANMVGQSRDGLDVMLVFMFTGWSVSRCGHVISRQVSQNLQADYMQMSAVLLHDLVFLQLALADGVSVANITRPSVNPAQAYVADGITVWVNGLWVVSLLASLTVALVAVLAKQWLHHYVSLPSGTPKQRSHIRHFRFMGLEQWRVLTIIGTLPIVMHISLTLFLSGLILFFIPLRQSLAWAVGMITVVISVLYLVANAMPIFFPRCPYKTLFTESFTTSINTYCRHQVHYCVGSVLV
ncbi:hypothetical protein BDZ89DRAFT_1160984 [Hymenopellis radicata]|nr:hypothetical protein BDZ89DRAFT_1160984 [Hymenopellis radicata]